MSRMSCIPVQGWTQANELGVVNEDKILRFSHQAKVGVKVVGSSCVIFQMLGGELKIIKIK